MRSSHAVRSFAASTTRCRASATSRLTAASPGSTLISAAPSPQLFGGGAGLHADAAAFEVGEFRDTGVSRNHEALAVVEGDRSEVRTPDRVTVAGPHKYDRPGVRSRSTCMMRSETRLCVRGTQSRPSSCRCACTSLVLRFRWRCSSISAAVIGLNASVSSASLPQAVTMWL